jgi:hypothetical protein
MADLASTYIWGIVSDFAKGCLGIIPDLPYGNSVNVVGIDEVVDTKARLDILVRKLHEGIRIVLDLNHQHMFFQDLGGLLYSSNLDGTCKTTIMPDIGGAVTGIAYVE